jgi:hypothetical protein
VLPRRKKKKKQIPIGPTNKPLGLKEGFDEFSKDKNQFINIS